MFRLDTRWKHFYLKRRIYRHFWTATSVSNASGAIVSANASIISGALSVGSSIGGVLFNVAVSLDPGNTGISVQVPLNTRLNARYRHFWARRRTERHYWAQWEGANISSSLADGDLVVASLALIAEGQVSADAILAGQSLDAILASLVSGEATGDANADGTLLEVSTSVINGELQTDNFLDGQILPVGASIISGIATGESAADPAGIMRGMPPAFRHGKGRDNAEAFGDLISVGASLLAGVASVEHQAKVESFAKALPAARVSQQGFEPIVIAPAQFSIPREVPGAFVQVGLSLLPGIASADASASGAIIEDWLPNDERDLADLASLAA